MSRVLALQQLPVETSLIPTCFSFYLSSLGVDTLNTN
jgi:hypothetical protein